MKKLATLIFSMILITCFLGCGGKSDKTEATTANPGPGDVSAGPAGQPTPTDATPTDNSLIYTDSNILVVYFSQTGTTKKLAEYAAEYYQGDIFELTAKNPYTEEDVDYDNRECRAAQEQNDETSRPEFNGSVDNMEQYDMIILAYPIWFSKAPRIIATFIESYDFTGQTIVPFCTSSSTDIDESEEELHDLTSEDVTWMDGKRFDSTTTKEEIVDWLEVVCPME